jgi:hypothetical protein
VGVVGICDEWCGWEYIHATYHFKEARQLQSTHMISPELFYLLEMRTFVVYMCVFVVCVRVVNNHRARRLQSQI